MSKILLLDQPRTSQPPYPVGINWSDPITRDLLFAQQTIGKGFINAAIPDGPPVSGSSAVAIAGSAGMGLDFDGTVGLQIAPSTDARFNLAGELTILAWAVLDGAKASFGQYAVASGNPEANASQGGAGMRTANGVTKARAYWGGFIADGATSLDYGRLYQIGFVRSGASGAWTGHVILDGKSDGIISTATNPSAQQVLALAGFGLTTLSGLPFNGKIYGAMVFKRALSLAEVRSLYDNPYQVFTPEQIPIFIPDAASGAPTLSALTASLITSSGCRATVAVAR